jgi:hypothetical protein
VLGTPGPLPQNITVTLPTQTKSITINSSVQATPGGTGTIQLQDLYNGQSSNTNFPPGPDGRADDGTVHDSQLSGTIASLDLNLLDAPQSIAASSVSLSSVATISLFGFDVDVPLSLDLDPALLINHLDYTQINAAIMSGQVAINPGFADGGHPNVPGVENLSTQYNLVLSSGTFSGDAGAQIGIEFHADFGILGSYDQDLGGFTVNSGTISEDFGLIGVGRFLQIATALDASDYDDLLFQLEGNIDSLIGPLTLPVILTGTVPIAQSFEIPANLGFLGTITLDASFTGSVTYTIEGELTFANLAYALQAQQIAEAVNVPEASSLAMLGLAGLTGVQIHRRRKVRKASMTSAPSQRGGD